MKAKTSKKHKRKGINTLEAITVDASIKQLTYIDALLDLSLLNDNEVEEIRLKSYSKISEGEAEEIITYLLDNQKCLIDSGASYQPKDIEKKLAQFKER